VPDLPIRDDEIDAMKNAESNIDWLVGVHAESLMWQGWDHRVHPIFFDHVCGIMASEHAPDELREDRALQVEMIAHDRRRGIAAPNWDVSQIILSIWAVTVSTSSTSWVAHYVCKGC
jgi:hypothetical protein